MGKFVFAAMAWGVFAVGASAVGAEPASVAKNAAPKSAAPVLLATVRVAGSVDLLTRIGEYAARIGQENAAILVPMALMQLPPVKAFGPNPVGSEVTVFVFQVPRATGGCDCEGVVHYPLSKSKAEIIADNANARETNGVMKVPTGKGKSLYAKFSDDGKSVLFSNSGKLLVSAAIPAPRKLAAGELVSCRISPAAVASLRETVNAARESSVVNSNALRQIDALVKEFRGGTFSLSIAGRALSLNVAADFDPRGTVMTEAPNCLPPDALAFADVPDSALAFAATACDDRGRACGNEEDVAKQVVDSLREVAESCENEAHKELLSAFAKSAETLFAALPPVRKDLRMTACFGLDSRGRPDLWARSPAANAEERAFFSLFDGELVKILAALEKAFPGEFPIARSREADTVTLTVDWDKFARRLAGAEDGTAKRDAAADAQRLQKAFAWIFGSPKSACVMTPSSGAFRAADGYAPGVASGKAAARIASAFPKLGSRSDVWSAGMLSCYGIGHFFARKFASACEAEAAKDAAKKALAGKVSAQVKALPIPNAKEATAFLSVRTPTGISCVIRVPDAEIRGVGKLVAIVGECQTADDGEEDDGEEDDGE